MRECIFMAAFSQDKIRRIVSDMEHKSWKRKNNTGVPEEV
ncbi:laccase domain-containing protein, partial [Soehngenia saccharolytica]